MLKKTITYVDYDGIERTEDHYFNLSRAELMKMNLSQAGGLEKKLTKIINSKDGPAIMEQFEQILRLSYGVKSDDGKRFIKSDALFEEFTQTEAYSELFMELCTDANAASTFVQAILPKNLGNEMESPSVVPLS